MGWISDELREQVLQETVIVQLISEQLELKMSKGYWWGRCPFHNEDGQTMFVSPGKQYFKCNRCGESGNAIMFIMKKNQLSFPDAVRFLEARRAKITHGTVYVMLLADDHYFVGYTEDLDTRIRAHFCGAMDVACDFHDPVKIIEKHEDVPPATEKEIAQLYRNLHGARRVHCGGLDARQKENDPIPEMVTNSNAGGFLLQLEHDKYFVGYGNDLQKAMRAQYNGRGCEWTRLHRPVKILRTLRSPLPETEKEMTLQAMRDFGWENVRGYRWLDVEIKKPVML